jgi:AAA+ superfamily predicted ATPase
MTGTKAEDMSDEVNSHGDSAAKGIDKKIDLPIDKEIELLIRAKYPIIYVLTWEEERVAKRLSKIAEGLQIQNVRSWSVSKGFGKNSRPSDSERDPIAALDEIINDDRDGVFIFYDFHSFLAKQSPGRPLFTRKLRDLAISFHESKTARCLILMSPVLEIPDELEKDVTIIDYPLPQVDEIRLILEDVIRNEGSTSTLSGPDREKLLKAALGLTENEIRNVFSKAIVETGLIGQEAIQSVLDEKEQIIRKSGILEYFPFEGEFNDIGGLDALKKWLRQRANSFSDKAREFGLPEPKGILLVGVPGCGKSLSAKAVASEWKQPLLRLDIGKIFGGIVGASEENMRRSIKVAESVSPTILWLDEIEKGFAGMKSGGDSGVTVRVFGTLLTWMQEKDKPVFVIATANDISKLPPELLRKGRFDEIFFVDLPDAGELKEIFRIHLKKREREIAEPELENLAKNAEGYTGAEIEQIIISSLYDAFNDSQTPGLALDSKLIEKNLKETVPLSKTMDKEIKTLRGWAETRARFASTVGREVAHKSESSPVPRDLKLRTPYAFGNQQRVETFGAFRDQCVANESEIWDSIKEGRMEQWLNRNGLDKLAKETAELRVKYTDSDSINNEFGFRHFITLLNDAMKSTE